MTNRLKILNYQKNVYYSTVNEKNCIVIPEHNIR